MRRRVLFVLCAAALSVAGFATTAGASVVGAAPLTILKTVSGPVPAGTTFTATIECFDGAEIDDGDGGTTTATVTFDAAGQPTSADTVTFSDGPGFCTVTETASGGASSISYACAGENPIDGIEEPGLEDGDFSAQQVLPDSPVCPAAGPQAAPITVNIVNPGQNATVTIANTFADPVPAAQVVAQPAFTG